MNVNLRIQDSYSLALAASCSWTRSKWYSLPETTCKDIVWNIRFVLKISDGYILFSDNRVHACTVKLLAVNVASPSRAPVNWLMVHSTISASCLISAQLQEDVHISLISLLCSFIFLNGICHGTQLTNPIHKSQLSRAINYPLTSWDPEGLPLDPQGPWRTTPDPLGPWRPTPWPPRTVNRNQGSTGGPV